MVTVICLPMSRLPSLQVTLVTLFTVAFVQVPWLALTDLNSALNGSLSIATTPLAAAGPSFLTVIEYVARLPTLRVAGPVFVTERSAVGGLKASSSAALTSLSLAEPVTQPESFAGSLSSSV